MPDRSLELVGLQSANGIYEIQSRKRERKIEATSRVDAQLGYRIGRTRFRIRSSDDKVKPEQRATHPLWPFLLAALAFITTLIVIAWPHYPGRDHLLPAGIAYFAVCTLGMILLNQHRKKRGRDFFAADIFAASGFLKPASILMLWFVVSVLLDLAGFALGLPLPPASVGVLAMAAMFHVCFSIGRSGEDTRLSREERLITKCAAWLSVLGFALLALVSIAMQEDKKWDDLETHSRVFPSFFIIAPGEPPEALLEAMKAARQRADQGQ